MYKQEVEDLFKLLGCKEEITKEYISLALEAIITFDKKQADYGPNNIARTGEVGVAVRLMDKIERIWHLVESKTAANNESLFDSYLDVHIYGAIAMMCFAGVWPGVEGKIVRNDA